MNINFWEVLTILMNAIFIIAVIAGSVLLCFLIARTKTFQTTVETTVFKPTGLAFGLVGDVSKAIFNQFSGTFTGVIEFVTMFYEDNCPAVEIVSDEEATIDAHASGEE